MRAPTNFPECKLFEIDHEKGSLSQLFACLDAGNFRGLYVFGRFSVGSTSQYELFFKTREDADRASSLWSKHH